MAGPSPVWESVWSPESEDNRVQPKEPINQSGLTTTFHRPLFHSINKKRNIGPFKTSLDYFSPCDIYKHQFTSTGKAFNLIISLNISLSLSELKMTNVSLPVMPHNCYCCLMKNDQGQLREYKFIVRSHPWSCTQKTCLFIRLLISWGIRADTCWGCLWLTRRYCTANRDWQHLCPHVPAASAVLRGPGEAH